jgi:HK97 family phage major capsid protein
LNATTQSNIGNISRLTSELFELAALDSPSAAQSRRMATVQATLNAVKAGFSVEEIRNAEMENLRESLQLPRLPERARSRLGEQAEHEFRTWATTGKCRETFIPRMSDLQTRAQEAGSQSISLTQGVAGGYFVPQGFADRAFQVMKTYDAIFDPQYSNIIETVTGTNMPFPVWDDTANNSVQVSETNISSEVDIASFGSTQLNAWNFRSKIVAISLELLQDSSASIPIASILETVFASRHARGVGQALISGSGINTCTGLVTGVVASGVAATIASGSSTNDGSANTGANSIGTADINKLIHSLEPAYRVGACIYCNDNTVRSLKGLLDKQGHSIVSFRKGFSGSDSIPHIMSFPVAVCPSMADIGPATNPIIFGNPMYFVQRRVLNSHFLRRFWQNDKLVTNGLIGVESYMRTDSGIIAPNARTLHFNSFSVTPNSGHFQSGRT